MNDSPELALLDACFLEYAGHHPTAIAPLRPHASERKIFRITSHSTRVIGVLNPNRPENDAFVHFAKHFAACGLPVPAIHAYYPERGVYLEEDLGDETLFDFVAAERSRTNQEFPPSLERAYEHALEILLRFQIEAARSFDFSRCYPEIDLLPGTFAGDCSSFVQDLVARLLPHFDIASLTSDFAKLIAFLEEAQKEFFVYRDFQSRNIMRRDEKLFFIDFQSGRRGPLQYDVVSLLYQASTALPQGARERLAEYYCAHAKCFIQFDVSAFQKFYSGFIICRMLQVLGVYGRQGLAGGKEYFTKSIPGALTTLANELSSQKIPVSLPQLTACATALRESVSTKGVI